MADQIIQVAADSSGKKVDCSELTVGANTVERQRVVLAADATAAGLAAVQTGDSAGTEYALVVKPAPISAASQATHANVSLGTSTGKTVKCTTGSLVSTATTADQVICTYTVTAGKTLYLLGFDVGVRLTTIASTATTFGTASLENPSGTKLMTRILAGAGVTAPPPYCNYTEPLPIAAGTVIRIVCTPAAATSYTWQGNIWGYEK